MVRLAGRLGFALGCIGLYLIGTAIHPVTHFAGALTVRMVVLLAVVGAFAAVRKRVLQRRALRGGARGDPDGVDAALEAHAGVDVAAAFIPSELGVSDDFYLLTNSPDCSTVAVVGDIVGHGPKAARLATFVRAQIATFAANSSDPAEILTMTNAALLERAGRGEELVSAVCLRLHSETRALSWAVAGHPPPLELPGLEAFGSPGETLPLGVDDSLSLTTAGVPLGDGGGVLVYTDGATDVRIEEGLMLGLEGLQRLLAPVANLPAEPLVSEVEETLLDWAHGAIKDDICVLVLRPTGV